VKSNEKWLQRFLGKRWQLSNKEQTSADTLLGGLA
jgi:hypothetical protein